MKKIGFVDYYLSEWHANSYPAWIKEASEKLGCEYKIAYAWAEEYTSPVDNKTTDDWCAAYGAEKCATLAELCEKSDYIVVLAPSNPETHLRYAEEVLKYGKRTYIDKTFSPDFATAKKIFELGEKYGTSFFSSSALRYSKALEGLKDLKSVTTFGGGSNFPEYAVHQAEMIIATLKCEPVAVRVEKQGKQYITSVKLEGDKEATMIYSPSLSFAIAAETADGVTSYAPAGQGFFLDLILDIVNFFETGEVSFNTAETLTVMKLREAAVSGMEKLGEWINI